ncbi:MAG: acetate/propionate family kinase [Acidobacteriota bacterium]
MTPVGNQPHVLALNGGSSSVRFAVHQARSPFRRLLHGKVDRIGRPGTNLVVNEPGAPPQVYRLEGCSHRAAVSALLARLGTHPLFASVAAVGHRVVHGMEHSQPERVTPALLAELRRVTPFDPEHLPGELALIDEIAHRFPKLPQVVCFDTAFHRTMPRVATLLPLPRRVAAGHVHRYGFHGLSYAYLMEALRRLDRKAAQGRVILAHLGNGASLAAVRHGASIDTSMGFTPTGGLVMGTRSGDLDPGLVDYLAREQHMTAARFRKMVNQESGLLGVSETSADMRDLLARESSDVRAAEAVDLFCYQARKWVGAYAAALGGLETLVFSGGIGENAAVVRARICEGLSFLGIALNSKRNAAHAPLISADGGRVQVRVIATDEERMVVKAVNRTLDLDRDAGRNRGRRRSG